MDTTISRDLAPQPIDRIASDLGLESDDFEPVGRYKAKLSLGLEARLRNRPQGKYVGVTAISPTPLGEGKTIISIGLATALCREGKRAIVTLREPSLAPVFGVKGGGAGGGKASLFPRDDINLHFTGDLHAVGAANNLLAAVIDNHIKRELEPRLDPDTITWRRVVDVSDKALSHVVAGLGTTLTGPLRETGFDLTAASEVMAILALSRDLADLRIRLGRIFIGESRNGKPVFAQDLHCAGAMAALLRDALRPNLVQTSEQTPAFVHSGPFANISHGNSSVIADLAAIRLADYVVTESGFGSDCGAEKLFDIKCRVSGLVPAAEVLVCTVRSLKLQSGQFHVRPGMPLPEALLEENLDALRDGAVNLDAHLRVLKHFGVPVVVAINRFPTDSQAELDEARRLALEHGAFAAVVAEPFSYGSVGAGELARAVIEASESESRFDFLYPLHASPEDKLERIATAIYGADGIRLERLARRQLERYKALGFGDLPICIAKTQYSLSHDPKLAGRPRGFLFPIREIRVASGAGYLYALAGDISTMPGLPTRPSAVDIDIDHEGRITGIH